MSKSSLQPASEFADVLRIIQGGRAKAFEAVNVALMETYWTVGAYLSRKLAEAGWGKGVVLELAGWLRAQAPEVKGFSAQNLWRMKQFYEVYAADEKLSALPRVLSWTHYCNRHPSPTLVAEYKTKMIPKSVLQQKLHEWSQMLQVPGSEDEGDEA